MPSLEGCAVDYTGVHPAILRPSRPRDDTVLVTGNLSRRVKEFILSRLSLEAYNVAVSKPASIKIIRSGENNDWRSTSQQMLLVEDASTKEMGEKIFPNIPKTDEMEEWEGSADKGIVWQERKCRREVKASHNRSRKTGHYQAKHECLALTGLRSASPGGIIRVHKGCCAPRVHGLGWPPPVETIFYSWTTQRPAGGMAGFTTGCLGAKWTIYTPQFIAAGS